MFVGLPSSFGLNLPLPIALDLPPTFQQSAGLEETGLYLPSLFFLLHGLFISVGYTLNPSHGTLAFTMGEISINTITIKMSLIGQENSPSDIFLYRSYLNQKNRY